MPTMGALPLASLKLALLALNLERSASVLVEMERKHLTKRVTMAIQSMETVALKTVRRLRWALLAPHPARSALLLRKMLQLLKKLRLRKREPRIIMTRRPKLKA